MSGGTFASVTDERCRCEFLENEANDPESPIVFDSELNEFRFEYSRGGKAEMMLYHCPFCGGTAPESFRKSLFAVITDSERQRLFELTGGIKTIADAVSRFGVPEIDEAEGLIIDYADEMDETPKTECFRKIGYLKLSETADVYFVDFHKEKLHVILQGKYIGSKE